MIAVAIILLALVAASADLATLWMLSSGEAEIQEVREQELARVKMH